MTHQRPANRRHPCFCAAECPPGFVPHLKYRVSVTLNNCISDQIDWKVYEFLETTPSDGCIWEAKEIPQGGDILRLLRIPIAPTLFDHEYKWELTVQRLPCFEQYSLEVGWDDDTPIVSGLSPACDVLSFDLTDPITSEIAEVEAVPEWMCTDLQARAWPAE